MAGSNWAAASTDSAANDMEPNLREYYEQELTFLKKMGAEFAEKYPKMASRLVLGAEDNADPHVERLLEGVAFLTARVHLKIDDDFPEISDALLNIIYPHYLRPIPAMSVVEFQADPQQGKLTGGLTIPRGSMLYTRPVNGSPCRFATTQETTLWPVEVASADWRAPERLDPPLSGGGAAVIRLELRCAREITFDQLALRSLRFYLTDESVVPSLYELLLHSCAQILVRDPNNRKRPPLRLSASSLRAVGFDADEALLPYTRRSFDGYRLLHEYFAFPKKFHFVELSGLESICAAGFKDTAEILFVIAPFERRDRAERLELGTTAQVFRLGCSPVVNLFPQTAEPILLKHTEHEYRIVPDARRQRNTEVFSVDEVVSATTGSASITRYQPYYSFRHADTTATRQAFWHAARRQALWRAEGGTDMYLSVVDLSGRPVTPDVESLTVRLTCSNRDLPSMLPFGLGTCEMELEGSRPIRKVIALEKPTPSIPAPTRRGAYWRLISHLALNHLSLVSEGKEALQEILRVYNFTGSAAADRQVQAIRSVDAQRHFATVSSPEGASFARGFLVKLELDEEEFAGGNMGVFAAVLERFLGMYATLNSFSQLAVRTPQRKEDFALWPARAGSRILM
jgi:type VI secretion system protein ImpG